MFQAMMNAADSYDYTVSTLNLSRMGLHTIPSLERFTRLTHLDISENQLSALPELPDSLTHLNCSNNNIVEVFILPKNLVSFNCNNNLIVKIHMIPNTLDILECENNLLRRLPLLKNITQLSCSYNELWGIPKPNKLEFISCSHNTENISEYNEKTLIMESKQHKILDVVGSNETSISITY
jgi:Leucine-rich repeat (LRR) protein